MVGVLPPLADPAASVPSPGISIPPNPGFYVFIEIPETSPGRGESPVSTLLPRSL